MSYSVGQIIYVVLNKRQTVIPAQVVEETVRRSLDGEITTYSVVVPNSSKKSYPLNELDGDVYVTLDEVRDKLMKNAQGVIDELIGKARNLQEQAFAATPPVHPPLAPTDSDSMKVTLEDGTVANVKMTTPGGVQ